MEESGTKFPTMSQDCAPGTSRFARERMNLIMFEAVCVLAMCVAIQAVLFQMHDGHGERLWRRRVAHPSFRRVLRIVWHYLSFGFDWSQSHGVLMKILTCWGFLCNATTFFEFMSLEEQEEDEENERVQVASDTGGWWLILQGHFRLGRGRCNRGKVANGYWDRRESGGVNRVPSINGRTMLKRNRRTKEKKRSQGWRGLRRQKRGVEQAETGRKGAQNWRRKRKKRE